MTLGETVVQLEASAPKTQPSRGVIGENTSHLQAGRVYLNRRSHRFGNYSEWPKIVLFTTRRTRDTALGSYAAFWGYPSHTCHVSGKRCDSS